MISFISTLVLGVAQPCLPAQQISVSRTQQQQAFQPKKDTGSPGDSKGAGTRLTM